MFEKEKSEILFEEYKRETKLLDILKNHYLKRKTAKAAAIFVQNELSDFLATSDNIEIRNSIFINENSGTLSIVLSKHKTISRFIKIKKRLILIFGEDKVSVAYGEHSGISLIVYWVKYSWTKTSGSFDISISNMNIDKCEIEYVEETKKVPKLSGLCAEMFGIKKDET